MGLFYYSHDCLRWKRRHCRQMKPTPYILFRRSLVDQEEVDAARKYFNVVFQHEEIPSGSLVIPRYSALPFYQYLEDGIKVLGSSTINTYRQHRYVADIESWYPDFELTTPTPWVSLESVPRDLTCSFVLKGETNSKKHEWNTHMFAKSYADINQVHKNLTSDSLIGSQKIQVRKYVPLREVGTRIDGRPVTEEYRVFVLDGKILSKAFYWSEYYDVVKPEDQDPGNIPEGFLSGLVDAVGDSIRFWVVDVARTAKGSWMVIELNDGQMSGLSLTDPCKLYKEMATILT